MTTENIVGNTYDKYATKNPIARAMTNGFLSSVTELFNSVSPDSVLEVGCGEGHLSQHLLNNSVRRPSSLRACDLSIDQVAEGLDPMIQFEVASIYELPYEDNSYDLVVCCEVLEHLEEPSKGLSELCRVAKQSVLISTPWEPVWRMLNMARGKYLSDFGNTPGHIQNFSRSELINLASSHMRITDKKTPLPWTILLGKPLDKP